MPRKQQKLANKLDSWTDQANLTRQQPATTDAEDEPPAAPRTTYLVERSLIDRIADTATQHGLTQNEVIGYLLTWALDQVDAGLHPLRDKE
jgi:hypothetical protein